jgi:hypothetical protein
MEHQHGWLTITCDTPFCSNSLTIAPHVTDVVATMMKGGWHRTPDGSNVCPFHPGSGLSVLLALQLDNIHHEVQQMAQTIDELKTLVQAFNATLTADVAAAAQAIADLKAEIATLKGAPPASVDFQPELDAANAQLAALEAATASAKS